MSLTKRDKNIIWHPYTQHQLNPDSIGIVKAKGVLLYDEQGKKYIDALSSWWTCLHGHSHPYIARKVSSQLKKLEHVIFAGFTHQPSVELAERLLKRLPKNQSRIFFSDNGSTSVEVALKMCFQYWFNKGKPRLKVVAFKNGYHGDTIGAMSISERGAFSKPFESQLFDVHFIDPPTKGKEITSLNQLKAFIERWPNAISCFIFEPLLQGVAGMVPHDGSMLSKMISLCKQNTIFTIADEVFTGFGRTGKFFATDHIKNKPDIYCLSKGLTGGVVPMGITSCTEKIFRAFLSKDRKKTFFHGHSFTANPIACSAALASMDLLDRKSTWLRIDSIVKKHSLFKDQILKSQSQFIKKIKEVRQMGTVLAIELKTTGETSYFNSIRDKTITFFYAKGILLRPLGNVIYLVPPYCISDKDLDYIYDSILEFLNKK